MTHPQAEPLPPAGPDGLDETSTSAHVGHEEHAAEAGEHGYGAALGRIDWAAYGAGVLGILIGLGTALAFVIATNRLG